MHSRQVSRVAVPWSRTIRISITLGVFAGYSVLLLLTYGRMGVIAASLSVIPLVCAGFLLGWRGGLLAGVVSIGLHVLLFDVLTPSGITVVLAEWPGSVMGVVVGGAAGWLSEFIARVKRQAQELARERAALQAEIAERMRIQEELAEARRSAETASSAKTMFLANMSHEFRTPLTSILGFSDLIHMQATQAGNQELMADINRIRKASHHLLHLINDVLDLGRIEAGRMELHAEYFDLALFVDEVADLVKPLVQKQHNTIHIQAANVPPVVYADRGKIQQILLNLLSNAAKFTSDGTITLAVAHERAAEQDWICFDVTDTGIGIADEHLEKLFQPFSQLSNAATRGSSGLGLALSQSFSKLMGGSISVQSRSGSGSTFAVRLPVLVERQTDEPPALDAGNAKEIMA